MGEPIRHDGYSVGGDGACCRMDGRGPRARIGVWRRWQARRGDILPARAVPDGEGMEVRGGLPTAAAPRGGEGGRRADEPIKKGHLADGRGGARVGKEGGVPAAFASLVSGIQCVSYLWGVVRF